MTKQQECAHCDDGTGPDSMDYSRRVICPACELPICRKCRKASTPTHCGFFTEAGEEANVTDSVTSKRRNIK